MTTEEIRNSIDVLEKEMSAIITEARPLYLQQKELHKQHEVLKKRKKKLELKLIMK